MNRPGLLVCIESPASAARGHPSGGEVIRLALRMASMVPETTSPTSIWLVAESSGGESGWETDESNAEKGCVFDRSPRMESCRRCSSSAGNLWLWKSPDLRACRYSRRSDCSIIRDWGGDAASADLCDSAFPRRTARWVSEGSKSGDSGACGIIEFALVARYIRGYSGISWRTVEGAATDRG